MEAPTAPDLLDELRGDRSKRPLVDRGLAGGLRAWLEDELAEITLLDAEPQFLTPRSVTTMGLRSVPGPEVRARAALVGALVTQRIMVGDVSHPMDDALGAIEADDEALGAYVHSLDPDAFAHLAAEVTAHDAVLSRCLQQIPGSWLPRCSQRLSISLRGGAVVLSARPSLIVGPPAVGTATVCLLEVTTSLHDEDTVRRLGILALLETLRSSCAPLRVASLSSATGRHAVLDVHDAVLTAAVGDVISAVRLRATP